jgi:lysophospholipase L1-like esterase
MRNILTVGVMFAGTMLISGGASYAQDPASSEKTATQDCGQAAAGLLQRVTEQEIRLLDWAQLARYREANTKLATPEAREKRVVFMGDSITDAWVEPRFGGFFPGKPYVDRGISGQTTPQMLIRFRPDVIALAPKAVVILAGTNDLAGNTGPMTLEETEGNLASMSELAHSHGIRVVLASVLPVSNYGPTDMRIDHAGEKILALNAWIKKYSADNGHVYLDYFTAMVDEHGLLKKELSEDGLHPNAAGYAVMAPLAEEAIKATLKRSK